MTGPKHANSADGTRIAYWESGEGDTIVLVHGITSTHTTMDELVPHLASRRRVVVFDRRGRGESGDGDGTYDMNREYEDVVAVMEAAADSPVDVFSHSYGSYLAAGAAALRPDLVRKLVLYSPGFGDRYPEGVFERLEDAVEEDPAEALVILMREVIGMPEDDIEFMRKSPAWAQRIEAIHTVPRECRADAAYKIDPDFLNSVKMPVLILNGAKNPPNKQAVADALNEVLPDARLSSLPKQGHAAHHTGPDELATAIFAFLDDDKS